VKAIDDGYGEIKTYDGRDACKYPSLARFGKHFQVRMGVGLGDGNRADEIVLESEGEMFTLGDGPDLIDTRFNGWPTSALNRVLSRYGLMQAGMRDGESIVTGLPMSGYFDRQGVMLKKNVDARKATLIKSVLRCMGPEEFASMMHLAMPGAVRVIPQGMAAIFDYIIQEDGSARDVERVAVIDVGARTTDVAAYVMDENMNGAIEMQRSGGIDMGMLGASDVLGQKISRELGQSQPIQMSMAIKAMRDKSVKIYGKRMDVGSIRLQALYEHLHTIMNQAEHLLSGGLGDAGLRDIDCVLIAGGGAYAVQEVNLGLWANTVIPEKPEFANVRGMWKLGHQLDRAG
jgi:plasmid segregation protein ParM